MNFRDEKNPLDAARVADVIKNFCDDVPTQAVSFTGGEPLLHWQFVRDAAAAVNGGVKIFLETNGTLYREFEKISDVVDIVSADIKLPHVVGRNLRGQHEKFLRAAHGKDLYVKIVVTDKTTREEFLSAVELIANVDAETLLIIQPVTPVAGVGAASAEKILSCQAAALRLLKNVRVIPQTHKFIGAL